MATLVLRNFSKVARILNSIEPGLSILLSAAFFFGSFVARTLNRVAELRLAAVSAQPVVSEAAKANWLLEPSQWPQVATLLTGAVLAIWGAWLLIRKQNNEADLARAEVDAKVALAKAKTDKEISDLLKDSLQTSLDVEKRLRQEYQERSRRQAVDIQLKADYIDRLTIELTQLRSEIDELKAERDAQRWPVIETTAGPANPSGVEINPIPKVALPPPEAHGETSGSS